MVTPEDVSNIVKEKQPQLDVLPLSELKNVIPDWQNYGAYYSADLAPDLTPVNPKLFIKTGYCADDMQKLIYASNVAHEYTHAHQGLDSPTTKFVQDICDCDYQKGITFTSVGFHLFSFFDNEFQAFCVVDAMRKSARPSDFMKYGCMCPRKSYVSKSDILKATGAKDEEEFKKIVNYEFNKRFVDLMQHLIKNQPEVFEDLPCEDGDMEKLLAEFKKFCALKADSELEAYSTESVLAQDILGQNNLNINLFPTYYRMLRNALSQ